MYSKPCVNFVKQVHKQGDITCVLGVMHALFQQTGCIIASDSDMSVLTSKALTETGFWVNIFNNRPLP